MAWLDGGDKERARSAYEDGLYKSRSSSNPGNWPGYVFSETLRREVELMLAAGK
jgi:hypothetical protein